MTGPAETIAAVRAYRATRPRDFPLTPADKRLAAKLRTLGPRYPQAFLAELRRGRW